MFNEIGKKIKGLASVIAWIGIIASAIMGLSSMKKSALAGILIIAIGALVSWVSSFLLYGYGELIDQTSQMNVKISSCFVPQSESEVKRKLLRELVEQGIITDDEYKEAVSK